MSDSWSELYTLFGELADLDAASRDARLREIGARDRALRDQLEAMLAADASARTRLDEYAQAAARSILAAPDPRSADDPLGIAGTTVEHYRIDGLLGAGGMGVVYRATDVRLERPVALKFLSPGWSMDAHAKRRFLHEARTASSLDHPNICTIYEVDQTGDGTLYIAMACYEGATLRERLKHGPLEIATALDLAAQTARGLAAAHARGLVHRDIKPGNLLVTVDGIVKILDFGVVKAADLGLTMPGQRPGTAAYMAPEQARGETVDGRADLWSLGVVLHQMLTGARPDMDVDGQARPGDPARPGGETESAGGRTGALPPSALRPGVPDAVDALVLQLIEDSPEARPQRAEDVAAELERLAFGGDAPGVAAARAAGSVSGVAGAGPTFGSPAPAHGGATGEGGRGGLTAGTHGHRIRDVRLRMAAAVAAVLFVALAGIGAFARLQDGSAPGGGVPDAADSRFVAVLPFANAGPESEDEYFADGVTDDIRTRLALVPELSILSRTTAMRYKGTDKSIPQIAEELGVEYVLEGSIRRLVDRVRISASLTHAASDRQVWVEQYDREIEDIFAVQEDIAQSIVTALETELSAPVVTRIRRRPTEDLEAYDLFLFGRASLYRYDVEGTELAIDALRQALDRDPAFTLARAWLSGAFALHSFNVAGGSVLADSAVILARQAVAEEPTLADGHVSLGTALLSAGRYEEGIAALERALDLNPNEWAAITNLGIAYAQSGRLDEAIRYSEHSIELEARSSLPAYVNLAWYSVQLGLYDRAEAALALAEALEPGNTTLAYNRAWLHMVRDEREAALEQAERLAAEATENPRRGWSAVDLFTRLGEVGRALDVAEIAYERAPNATGIVHLGGVLYGYALDWIGQPERARAVLAEAERQALGRIEAGDEQVALRYSLASIHALRGDTEAALHWLEEVTRLGWNSANVAASDPTLDSLREDHRFQLALDQMERDLGAMRERVRQEGW